MVGNSLITVYHDESKYLNAPARVAVAPAVVTVTVAKPTAPAGVTAVKDVPALFTCTRVAATQPTITLAPVKFVPVIVIGMPPEVGRLGGLTEVIVGTATGQFP